jgi:uncharacterized protein YkwD
MTDPASLRALRAGISLCLSAIVAACGGGGGDGESTGTTAATPAPAQVTTPALATPATVAVPGTSAPAPAPAPVTPVAAAVDVNCGLNGAAGIQGEVMQRVNALRAAGAVCGSTTYAATVPLAWNSLLLQAASGHSSDMAQNNYFSHTSLDGRTMVQRVVATGYTYSALGENIAAGQSTVESVITGWTNSPGHCQNLMNPAFRDIGVACVRSDTSNYRYYWTMVLGRS